MDWRGWAEIVFTIALTVAVGWPLGIYMARVWARETTPLDLVLKPVEAGFYAALGIDRNKGQNWLGSDALLDNARSHAWHIAAGFKEIERIVVFGKPLD